MPTRSYPIPGEILNSGDFFGLSYDQLLMIGFLPIIVMMFSFITGVIPTWVSLVLGIITAIAAGIVVAKSPEGQDPFAWAGAAFQRRLTPDQYTLQPTNSGRPNAKILDVIHTADNPGELSPEVAEKVEQQHGETESDTNASTSFNPNNN